MAMAINNYEGRTGGKICKKRLWRVRSSPYDSPPSAARGMCRPPHANEAGGSGWFSRLLDPVARVIGRSVSGFFSSVFGRGLVATAGENISTVEEVPKVKSSVEIREQGRNSINISLSLHYDGSDTSKKELISQIDAIFQLEQLLNRKRFSRVEIDQLEELLLSGTLGPSTSPLAYYKNMEKISEDSCINPCSSHQVVTDEKEKGLNANVREQMVNQHGNVKSEVNANIREQGFDSPIEIAETYLASNPQKVQGGRSKLYEMARSTNWKSSIMKQSRKNNHYKGIDVEPLETWSTPPSVVGHFDQGQVGTETW